MNNEDAFGLAKRKARHGHRDWIVYRDRGGAYHAAQRSPAAIKAAMLAAGTGGRWSLIAASTAVGHKMTWRMGVTMLRNARYGL